MCIADVQSHNPDHMRGIPHTGICIETRVNTLVCTRMVRAAYSWFHVSTGQSGLGKSTLVNTLFKSKVSRKSCTPNYEEKISKTVKLHSVSHGESTTPPLHYEAETEQTLTWMLTDRSWLFMCVGFCTLVFLFLLKRIISIESSVKSPTMNPTFISLFLSLPVS